MSVALSLAAAAAVHLIFSCVETLREGEGKAFRLSFVQTGMQLRKLAITYAPQGLAYGNMHWRGLAFATSYSFSFGKPKKPWVAGSFGSLALTANPKVEGSFHAEWNEEISGHFNFADGGRSECQKVASNAPISVQKI
jgi:hypothetical protein